MYAKEVFPGTTYQWILRDFLSLQCLQLWTDLHVFFVTCQRKTDKKCDVRMWYLCMYSSLDKHQDTMHLAICVKVDVDVVQTKPIVVFCGKGNWNFKPRELPEWDPRVHIIFHKNAWVNTETVMYIVGLYKMRSSSRYPLYMRALI